MPETVNRVARAIFAATPPELGRVAFDDASELARRIAVEQALAALDVLRQTGLPPQDEHEAEVAQVVSRIAATLPARTRPGPKPRRESWNAAMAGLVALAAAAAALVFLYWPAGG